MRPLRLVLDGFGTYRQTAEADFSDVDFFALTGPTGSGKSTIIDGLCFALYGTVPRWSSQNAIAYALAPSSNACRVCLIFETAGGRYTAIRALSRDRKGQVHTKEARLERLDRAVPADAPVSELLEASVEQLAEGPDQVKQAVQELLGLSYEHFTQSVLLPQGRFAQFLHASSGERQKLLVQLLAFGVYEQVGQRARDRSRQAGQALQLAEQARAELAGATEAAVGTAEDRVKALTSLTADVEAGLAELARLSDQATEAQARADGSRSESDLLGRVRVPAGVPGLAERIGQADEQVTGRGAELAVAEQRLAEAEQARAALPAQPLLEQMTAAYAQRRRFAQVLAGQERAEATAGQAEAASAAGLRQAEQEADRAAGALAAAQRAETAATLAAGLSAGQDCPVCLRPLDHPPHPTAAAQLSQAAAAADQAARQLRRATAAHRTAERDAATVRGTADGTRRQLAELAGVLAECPPEAEVAGTLRHIESAEAALRDARRDAAARRSAAAAAQRDRSALDEAEQQAWAALQDARDRVVALGAPPAGRGGLAAAWRGLARWAAAQREQRAAGQQKLDEAAAGLRRQAGAAAETLTGLLRSRGITPGPRADQAAVAVSRELARAEHQLDRLRADRRRAVKLDREIATRREEQQVATELGRLLRASSFERWLCGEALDSLVTEASATLMELSGGHYQLDRDERNELMVIDFEDAGASRPVHTLSGGETFQASLALALALSRQVTGLSAGQRDLNSMFLDEGFGTLDEDTLETVATTLERLAASSERMVGIVTHVAALAERVPVRFVVGRASGASTLRKEHV